MVAGEPGAPEALIEAGRMRQGLAQIEAARKDGRWDAAYAPASKAKVPPDFQAALMEPKSRGLLRDADQRQ